MSLLKNLFKPKFLSVISILIILVGFQNCGDIKVNDVIPPPEPIVASSVEANVCPAQGDSVKAANRVVFIVDMSLSNLGGFTRTEELDGTYTYSLTLDQATDLNAARLQVAVRQVTQGIDSESVQFSVIGFNDTVVMAETIESCSSPFITGQQVLDVAEPFLYAIHQSDKSSPVRPSPNGNSPFKMRSTSYMSALDCLEKKITLDVQSDNKLKAYNIVFLTDGAPTDASDPCDSVPPAERSLCVTATPEFNTCRPLTGEAKENCNKGVYANTYYRSRLENLRDNLENRTLGVKMYSIYYGPEAEFPQANAILNQLNHVFDQQIDTQKISNFSTVIDSLKSSLDIYIDVNYRIIDFSAINLTSIPGVKGLGTDSNMNGVSDTAEATPQPDIRAIFDEYKNNFNQDKDDLPSFLERIRGLSVTSKDSSGMTDGDGLTNYTKVLKGYPLKNSETVNPTLVAALPRLTTNRYSQPACGAPGYEYTFQINYMPLAEGLTAYSDGGYVSTDPSSLNFSHSADENLILLLYTAEPLNTRIAKRLLFGQTVRMNVLNSETFKLNASDFKFLGELQ